MKHLIKNNEIVQSGLPSHFTRENGEGFWGGYENRTDLHFEDGWRDDVVPEHDPLTQYIFNRHYDPDLDVVTYDIEDIVIDLEQEQQIHLDDLYRLREEISILATQIRLLNDTEPEALVEMSPMIRGLYAFAKEEIQSLTVENVRQYVLRGPQVQQLIGVLKQML